MQRSKLVARGRKKPKRRGYVRPSRAKPKTGWTLRELAALVGVAPRTLRLYLKSGVLPTPAFKGSATRYQRPHVVRVVAARRLMATKKQTLAAIYSRLQALSAKELDSLATNGLPPGPLATALGMQHASAARAPASLTVADGSVIGGRPRWTRLELALGLELHLRDDASPHVLDLARRIHDLTVAGAGASE
jgi:DNA-binding transcriptional MerR regulator